MTEGRHSVLCVESSENSRHALQAMLHDYDCSFACDPYEALRHAHADPCDAYVLDYWMPEWSGPLLCREIRKRDPHCAVIVCGSANNAACENRAFGAGASAYITKLDEQALIAKLFTLIATGDSYSTRAQSGAGLVLGNEMKKRISMLAVTGTGRGTIDELKRAVRSPTFRAYIDGGGTRACFERWWPERFETLRIATAY